MTGVNETRRGFCRKEVVSGLSVGLGIEIRNQCQRHRYVLDDSNVSSPCQTIHNTCAKKSAGTPESCRVGLARFSTVDCESDKAS